MPCFLRKAIAIIVVPPLLSACTSAEIVDVGESKKADTYSPWCGYEANHSIYKRLECLRVTLAE